MGELTTAQRDAFEEHYFECMECAADVKAAAGFIDNSRQVLRAAPTHLVVGAPAPVPGRGWFWWLRPAYAMGAMALLLAVILYQNLVTIPQSKRELAQALPTFALNSATRAEADVPEIAVRNSSPFGIYIDIPANEKFTSYSCELRTQEGKRKLNIDVSSTQARDSVQLLIPGGTLDPGQYTLVVLGRDGAAGTEEVLRKNFVVKKLP